MSDEIDCEDWYKEGEEYGMNLRGLTAGDV